MTKEKGKNVRKRTRLTLNSSELKTRRRRRNAKGEKKLPYKLVVMPVVPSTAVLGKSTCVVNDTAPGWGFGLKAPAETVIPLSGFKIRDCQNEEDSMAVFGVPVDGNGDKTFLCWKASKRRGIGAKDWENFRQTFTRAFAMKPNAAQTLSGSTDSYLCFEKRNNPKNGDIGTYDFKPLKNQDDLQQQEEITRSVGKLCWKLEKVTSSFIKLLPDEESVKLLQREQGLPKAFDSDSAAAADNEAAACVDREVIKPGDESLNFLQREQGLPKGFDNEVAAEDSDDSPVDDKCAADNVGYATQFSVGKNYWSKLHTDDDYFYTSLSCLSADAKDSKEILFYFVFQSYNVAVPMRSGDILVFNPRMVHGCTNPSRPDTLVFQCLRFSKDSQHCCKQRCCGTDFTN